MVDLNLLYEMLGWCGLLISAAVGNPIPEEIMLAMAGVRAGSSDHGVAAWLILPACLVGAVIADFGLYAIGRFFGARLIEHRWFSKLAPPEKRARTRENFNKYGVWILVFGRLVPGIRTTLFLTAGLIRMSIPKFLMADGIGALFGGTLIFSLAFLLGSQFTEMIEKLEANVSASKPIIFLALAVAGLGYLLYRTLRKPIPTGDPHEIPLADTLPKITGTLPKIIPLRGRHTEEAPTADGVQKQEQREGAQAAPPPARGAAPGS